jgi:hypothetical protein
MISMNRKLSFLSGFVLGCTVAGVAVLHAARLASPTWVVGEDLRRAFALEQRAKDAYRAGAIDEALIAMRSLSTLRRMRPTSEDQWSFTYPAVSLYLYLGGIDRDRFMGNVQPDSVQMLFACAEIYLLMKRGLHSDVDARIGQLKVGYPKVTKEHCSAIGAGYFSS